MTSVQIWIIVGVAAYMAIMLGIGVWASRQVHSTADYIVAGRRLGWMLSTGTIFATWFGAETCMGASATAYDSGILGVIADPFGAGLCLIISGIFFAKYFHKLKIETITDYFELRYGKTAAAVLTLFYVPVYAGWIGAQLVAFGSILNTLTGLPIMPSILIGTAVVLFYTYSGGMWADTMTDFFQMFVILVGFAIMIPFVYSHVKTAPGTVDPEYFRFFPKDTSGLSWLNYLQAWIVVGLGSLGGQDLLSRMLAAKNGNVARWSSIGAGVMYWTIGLIPVLLGIYGRLVIPPEQASGNSILIDLTLRFLPAPLVALIVGALLSAIMSSADSALLAPASIMGRNVVGYLKPGVSEETKLAWCKWSVPFVGICSLILALYFQNIYALCQEAWGLLLTAVTAPMIFGVYWKRATPAGAIAATLSGTVSWLALNAWLGPDYPTKLFGFLISCATIILVSLIPLRKGEKTEGSTDKIPLGVSI